MKKLRYLVWLLALLLAAPMAVARPAKDGKKPKKPARERPVKAKAQTAYLVGYATSLLDSTVYVTPLQRVDSVYIDSRTGFLMDRPLYSAQFQAYLEDSLKLKRMTTAVIFSPKEKKAQKKLEKVLKRTKADTSLRLTQLGAADFRFYAEQWSGNAAVLVDDEGNILPEESTKQEKKKKK